jgi:hypothetical protein
MAHVVNAQPQIENTLAEEYPLFAKRMFLILQSLSTDDFIRLIDKYLNDVKTPQSIKEEILKAFGLLYSKPPKSVKDILFHHLRKASSKAEFFSILAILEPLIDNPDERRELVRTIYSCPYII